MRAGCGGLLRVGIIVGALTLLLSGCADDGPRVVAAYGDPGSTRLEVGVDTCNRNPRATVVESDNEVRVTVEADEASGNGSDDCRDNTDVTLSRPLGTRTVVDEGTGDAVAVERKG